MLRSYFKTAWRSLLKNKFYSLINITGLAIGLAVGIMILLWVQDELSYDSFHHNAGSIYKINSHIGTGDGDQVWEGSPGPLVDFCKQIPGVERAVRINPIYDEFRFTYKDKKFFESNMAYVDSTFFLIFDFKLLEGNPSKPFPDMNSVIVSSSEAKKYFTDIHSALGKQLITDKGNFVVSGVMEDFPENSSLQYDMLLPMSFYASSFTKNGGNGSWKTIDDDLGNYYFNTYVQIQKNSSAEAIGKTLTEIFVQKKNDAKGNFFELRSLKSIHLIAADGSSSARQTVKIFLIVAILILFIACINYVNLSTARSMLRSKEVSVRKIIGAARAQLFMQFIAESALLFLFASILAFLIIYLLLPLYNDLSGKNLVFNLTNGNVWVVVGSAVCGALVLSGVYPALLLSSFKPLQALRGKLSVGIGNSSFRKMLVVTQFTFSVGLIISTIVISSQLQFIRDKDLGFNKEQVFSFGLNDQLQKHYDAVRDELSRLPGILGFAASNNGIAGVNASTTDTYWDGKPDGRIFMVHPKGIDQNIIPLLKMKMTEGSNFSGSKGDSAHIILNETAVKQAGIKNPVGKIFNVWQNKATIIGVVKDFNYASLKQAIEPAVFYYAPAGRTMYVKTTGKDASKVIAAVQKVWKSYSADIPFSYSFLDDDFNDMYQADQRTGFLFNIFAIIAIAISCLGLFGLATYTAQVKTKEISIRKVLGAGVANIANLLAKEFIILVIVAFVIAAPVAWFAMHKWLEDFAYRINISWWMFILAGLVAVFIALFTISFQAIKAALANPVKSLRGE